MHKAVQFNFRQSQSGAALVVALVLVLISSLLGVSAMQSSNVETQLANNTRFQQSAFRAAEAAADSLLTIENIVLLASDAEAVVQSTDAIEENVDVNASFILLGDSPATGYSLGGTNGFRSLKFVSSATASIDAVNTSSSIVQGVERLTFSREN